MSTKRSTKRKSPKNHAGLYSLGTVKRGCDQKMWIVVERYKSNNVSYKVWRPYVQVMNPKLNIRPSPFSTMRIRKQTLNKKINKLPKLQYYFTHDNFIRPFVVYVGIEKVNVKNENVVYIFKLPKDCDKESVQFYNVLVKKYTKVKHVWIGKHISDKESYKYPKGFGDGNSILLHLRGNRYVYIGDAVYEFNIPTDDKIVYYYTNIGNDDIPYSVAVGKTNVYFMLDALYVPKDKFEPSIKWMHVYSDFYGHSNNPWYKQTYNHLWRHKITQNNGFTLNSPLGNMYSKPFINIKMIHFRVI